jgi:hypothetical protein
MQLHSIAQPADTAGLVPFFNVTFGRFSLALVVAFGGGAFVGGIGLDTAYEVAQGRFSSLPYFFNGLGLLVCGWLAFSLHSTGRVIFFTLILTCLVSLF